jgi:hypothetical protein
MLKPAEFYMKMPAAGGYAEPLTFAAINYIISWFLFVSFSLLKIDGLKFNFSDLGVISVIMGVGLLLIFVYLIILALIANLLYRALGGTGAYEGTVRFLLYASAALVFSSFPYISAVATIYEMYLLIVGGMIVHNVSLKKSFVAVFLSFFLPTFVWILYLSFTH